MSKKENKFLAKKYLGIFIILLILLGVFYFQKNFFNLKEIDHQETLVILDKTPKHELEKRDKLLSLLEAGNPNSIFKVIDAIQTNSEISFNCHNIAHDIGHHSYELFGFNEAMTFDNPEHLNHVSVEHVCAGGYMHGVLEEVSLHDPNFKNNPESVCSRIPRENQASCFHGVGHVVMYAHERDVNKSIENCRIIKNQENMYRCFEGVRMEQFWGNLNDNPDINILGWDSKNPMNICKVVKEDEKPTCYLYSTFGYLRFAPRDYAGAASLCIQEDMNASDTSFCFKGLGMTMMSKFRGKKLESSEIYIHGYSVIQKHAFYQGLVNYSNLSGVSTDQLENSCNNLKNDTLICLDALSILDRKVF